MPGLWLLMFLSYWGETNGVKWSSPTHPPRLGLIQMSKRLELKSWPLLCVFTTQSNGSIANVDKLCLMKLEIHSKPSPLSCTTHTLGCQLLCNLNLFWSFPPSTFRLKQNWTPWQIQQNCKGSFLALKQQQDFLVSTLLVTSHPVRMYTFSKADDLSPQSCCCNVFLWPSFIPYLTHSSWVPRSWDFC